MCLPTGTLLGPVCFDSVLTTDRLTCELIYFCIKYGSVFSVNQLDSLKTHYIDRSNRLIDFIIVLFHCTRPSYHF